MRTQLLTTAAAAAALLTLTACSSSDDTKTDSTKPGTTATTPAASPTGTVDYDAVAKASGLPPKPTGSKAAALLAALRAVDPVLVAKPDKAISNARNQCQAINTGARRLEWSAGQRFGTVDHPVSDATGKQINQALQRTLCPKK